VNRSPKLLIAEQVKMSALSPESGFGTIGIIGLGYVGLPLAVAFAEAGCQVVGLDADPLKVELLNRKRWKTRVELANSIHDYIEIFHNTRRRHSSLNMLTPAEYERQHSMTTAA